MLKGAWIGDGLIDNDEKLASSENISNSSLERKNHSLVEAKIAKTDTLLYDQNRSYSYITHIKE